MSEQTYSTRRVLINFVSSLQPLGPSRFIGLDIIESKALTKEGTPYKQTRPWGERLFSMPWCPLRKTKTVVPQVPSDEIFNIGRALVMHPETAKIVREEFRDMAIDNLKEQPKQSVTTRRSKQNERRLLQAKCI